MSLKFAGNVTVKGGAIKVSASHNAKTLNTQMLIKFKTSEENLLDEVLRMYKSEKLMALSSNPNNKITAMVCNNNCVFVILPEAKALNVIAQTYKYIQTAKLNPASIKACIVKNQSYKKMHSDIAKGFEVIITGKCKRLVGHFVDRDKAIEKLSADIDAVVPKDLPDITITKKPEPYYIEYTITGSALVKLYFAIFFAGHDFVFKGNKLITDEHTHGEMVLNLKEYGGKIGGVVKSWLQQMGAKKTKPSANDDGGKKMKEANDIALENLNVMNRITCELHGLTYTPFTMGSWELDKAAVADVKKIFG